MSGPPTDAELLQVLEPVLGDVLSLVRAPYRYATSFPLEELHLTLASGAEHRVIFKDLSWDRLLPEAKATKPPFLHDPRRSIETHAGLLAPADVGPALVAAVCDEPAGRCWLMLEKVAGVELWQIGDRAVWRSVAAWLAGFHARFAGRTGDARRASPHLLVHDRETFRFWGDRAIAALVTGDDPRAGGLLDRLRGYDRIIDRLCAMEPVFVHGELYPSNVLVGVDGTEVRVWPIDWELAAIGPAALDLAALSSGWPAPERDELIDAYQAANGASATIESLRADVTCCRLHLALQWIGWSRDWEPPPEHATDWIGEAIDAAATLGLGAP